MPCCLFIEMDDDQFGRFTNRVGNLYLEVGIEFELYRVN